MRFRPPIRGMALLLLALGCVPAAGQDRIGQDRVGQDQVQERDRVQQRDEQIVVSASALPVPLAQAGRSLTVLDGRELERRGIVQLLDALREVPGVAVSQSGGFGQLAQLRIRGAEGNHTLVLVDGVDVSGVGQGETDASALLAGNIERVEILRGAQSGLYGSNALAGAINIVTRGGDGPAFSGAVEAGSFATGLARASAKWGDGETFARVSAIYRATGGISAAAMGTEPDSDRNATLYLRAGLPLGRSARLDMALRHLDTHTRTDGFDFSGGPDQGLAVDDDSFIGKRDSSGALTLTLAPARGWGGMIRASYRVEESTGGDGGSGTFGNRGRRLRVFTRGTADLPGTGALRHRITLFGEVEREQYRNLFPFDPSQAASQSRTLIGMGGEYGLDLSERMFLTGTIRHDFNDRFADATTFALAAAWLPGAGATRLHASFASGVTNPTFTEQFGFIPGMFIGNPDLVPERSRGFDIGLDQRVAGGVRLHLTYFAAHLDDEIVSLFPGVVNDTGRSEREGLELAADARLGAVDLRASYTLLEARDPDGTREIGRPRHQASLGAAVRFGPRHGTGGETGHENGRAGRIDAGLIRNGRRLDTDFRDYFVDGFTARKTSLRGYWLARVAASYALTPRIALSGRIENLFDADYQDVLSYGSPGLSGFAGIRIRIG